ncbi:MAG: Nramp family divalent metal transporter [Gammaproteobacteria bacterium]
MSNTSTRPPPQTLVGVLRYLGPGMILAAGLVGSGELIATTKAGAQAGITLLWVIVLGCVIKVFTQIELGRYTVSEGVTTLWAINRLPGPRFGAHWIIWLWLIMMATTYGMLGGILGGVAQAMAMIMPLTGDYALALQTQDAPLDDAVDTRIWAAIVAFGTSLLLFFGRYRLLELICIGMVFCFTVITVGNAIALQTTDYAIPLSDILDGLSFGVPDDPAAWLPALAAFGIIGVGGTDLIVYPYWCLQRGYADFIGKRSADPAWAERARGWLRVMKIDALVAMCAYTFSTVAFYYIGAAVLNREGADPDGMRFINTLAGAYVPVFGAYAKALFLAGALAVLYSTFMVANAGSAHLFADCLTIFGALPDDDEARRRAAPFLAFALPLVVLLIFLTGWNPVRMILVGGLVQSLILPIVGGVALVFRFRLVDQRLRPGKLWDAALLLSCLSLLAVGMFSASRILF